MGSTAAVDLRRVLLCQPRWLGDVLLCTPAVHALRRALPDARIDFLTERAGAAALAGNRDLSGILVVPAGALARARLLGQLRGAGYDAVVDFRSTGSTAAAVAATGAPLRVGTRGRGIRNAAYTHLLPRDRRPVYMARQKLRMLVPLGIDVADVPVTLRIAIGAAERQRAREVLAAVPPVRSAVAAVAAAAAGAPVAAITGASRTAAKRWGAVHWARIADRLAADGVRIILTHGPGEVVQAREIAALMRRPALVDYGTVTVRELAAVFAQCAVWAGNDGGAKHIAVAAGVPTVAVTAPGVAAVWNDPADPLQQYVEAERAPCTVCAAGSCLGRVSEAAVLDAIRRALGAA
jgi:ADP-heptose:LPS heptosyltransferase